MCFHTPSTLSSTIPEFAETGVSALPIGRLEVPASSPDTPNRRVVTKVPPHMLWPFVGGLGGLVWVMGFGGASVLLPCDEGKWQSRNVWILQNSFSHLSPCSVEISTSGRGTLV